MTTRTLVLTTFLLTAAGFAQAQSAPRTLQPPRAPDAPQAPVAPRMAIPPPAAPPAPAPPAPRKTGQPVNIKVEFTLTDQHGASPASPAEAGLHDRVRRASDSSRARTLDVNAAPGSPAVICRATSSISVFSSSSFIAIPNYPITQLLNPRRC